MTKIGRDAPGAISRNQVNARVSGRAADDNPTDTSKQNYTEVGWSNDKGSVRLGHIHKQADVTASVMLQTPDAEHAFFWIWMVKEKDGLHQQDQEILM